MLFCGRPQKREYVGLGDCGELRLRRGRKPTYTPQNSSTESNVTISLRRSFQLSPYGEAPVSKRLTAKGHIVSGN